MRVTNFLCRKLALDLRSQPNEEGTIAWALADSDDRVAGMLCRDVIMKVVGGALNAVPMVIMGQRVENRRSRHFACEVVLVRMLGRKRFS